MNLADAIAKISTAMQRLECSGLNRRAIVVLLQDRSGVPKKQINDVLDSLGELAKVYTR